MRCHNGLILNILIKPMYWRSLLMVCLLPVLAQSQPGTEILLFDLAFKDGRYVLSNGRNITNHKGYDNQPFFHPSREELYYSSAIDSTNVDIKICDLETGQTRQFTVTPENEFSPTVTPDQQFISCIVQRKNGAQDLGEFPIKGGAPVILINDLKVGYHAWADNDKLLLFVLGDSLHFLYYYDAKTGNREVIANDIGRSLHKIPGQQAVSFIQKNGAARLIRQFHAATKTTSFIVSGLSGKEDICWSPDGALFMSDGAKLFSFRPGKDHAWKEVAIEGDASAIKSPTRLAINAAGNKLAMVVAE